MNTSDGVQKNGVRHYYSRNIFESEDEKSSMADVMLLTELLVFAYIRVQSQAMNFPDAIKRMCMDYLQYITDEWVREDGILRVDTAANTIKLQPLGVPDLNDLIPSNPRRNPEEWKPVYGTLQVDAQFTETVVWTLLINSTKYSSMTYAYIGIASEGICAFSEYVKGPPVKGLDYGYCAFNGSTESIYHVKGLEISKQTGPVLKRGDRIEVRLNPKKRNLSFAVNGKRLLVGFGQIKYRKRRSYCLGVVIKYEDTEIALDDVMITGDASAPCST